MVSKSKKSQFQKRNKILQTIDLKGLQKNIKNISTQCLTVPILGAIVQIEQKRKQSKLKTADVLQLKADTVSYKAAQHK